MNAVSEQQYGEMIKGANNPHASHVVTASVDSEIENARQAFQAQYLRDLESKPITLGEQAALMQEKMAAARMAQRDVRVELGTMAAQGASQFLPTATKEAQKEGLATVQKKAVEIFGKNAGEVVAEEAVENGSKLMIAGAQAKNAIVSTGGKVSEKIIEKGTQKLVAEGIEVVGESALATVATEAAQHGAGTTLKSTLGKAMPYVGDVAVAAWSLYHGAKTQKEKEEVLTQMFVPDLLAKGIIAPDATPKYEDLKKLVATDPRSYEQLDVAIKATDNWVAPTLTQVAGSSAGSFLGSAAMVAAGTAAIVASGGTATPAVVWGLTAGGSVVGGAVAAHATNKFLIKETGFKDIQALEKKLQNGEGVTSQEVFQVLVRDDKGLQEAVEANNRTFDKGKKFDELTPLAQKHVIEKIGSMSEACDVLAERISEGRARAVDLLTLNNKALELRGAEGAEILLGAKEVKQGSVVSNISNEIPTTSVGSKTVESEKTVVGNRDMFESKGTAWQSQLATQPQPEIQRAY